MVRAMRGLAFITSSYKHGLGQTPLCSHPQRFWVVSPSALAKSAAMPAYSEFIDRLLLPSDLLRNLHPSEPYDREAVRRLQAADAATLGSPSGLVRGGVYYALDALDPAHELFQQE